MLQYIINTTAIWLLGLIVFDLLLCKEAHHGYNRMYLLVMLFAGALVPLWSWDYDSVIYATGVSGPIAEQAAEVRDVIVSGTGQQLLGWEDWLQIIYLTGVGISALLLAKDIVIITALYRKGEKSKDGTWTIVETGKPTSPFSAFRYVFISHKGNYTDDELQMILAHEEQHGHLLHVVDVLVSRMFTILFWFNPVVYLLEKRLLMVHEYQADLAVNSQPSVYGQFLVEQSVLNTAPVLAHSFTRSPLKKRLLMLTRKTTTAARGKQLLIAPVLLIAMLCFTKNAFSGDEPEINGNKVTYKGNIIEYTPTVSADTTIVINAVTGDEEMVITTRAPRPVTINAERVYSVEELKSARNGWRKPGITYEVLREYILTNMKKEIKKLNDGEYTITVSDIILDKKGNVVFFKYGGVHEMVKGKDNVKHPTLIDQKINERIARKISSLFDDAPAHNPAVFNSTEVYGLIEDPGYYDPFIVKDNKLESL
jgi:hypothetical protein